MTTQSEAVLEQNLIDQLKELEYESVDVPDEATLIANFKTQLEKHNEIQLSDSEFEKVLNHLNKGSVFEKAKTLRDKMHLVRDDGTNMYLEFLNMGEWCQNCYQVASQITMHGSYSNRYDVTLLINGLPLVQIELKRRGLELKEAFNQVNRYQRHSYDASHALFQYIQIFVISNGANTKYYANNRYQSFKQTFSWADKDNQNINRLEDFASVFLDPCHVSKMISKYTVLAETGQQLMLLRPYQYYAVEAITDRVQNSQKNGYIWHTTGSGKTLTSFKASQVMVGMPQVDKVVFVVDRNDLDDQTIREFNSFKKGSVDGTDNTRQLVRQFTGDDELIVTTIQKLNTAITRENHAREMEPLREQNIVFIFDECHRSQFGHTHQRISNYFPQAQMFGFTGTPIFADNAVGNELGKRTTKDLFDECLHKYVITDAIKDENVLKFSVEYVGRYKQREGSNANLDVEVEDIDRRELLESEQRLEKIADYILAHHDRKTHSREFNALFAISNVDVLTKYYEIFRRKYETGEHNLRIATIFTYTANEEDKDAIGLEEPQLDVSGHPINQHSRDKLESYIAHYNQMFGTAYTTKDSKSFHDYYKDVGKKLRHQELDILLVVNMFLTGFDSKRLNTLYVDKNLRYHGLIQAYSRTNRVVGERKTQGNIVVFRNLKSRTDEALELFANKDAQEEVFVKSYEEYVSDFNTKLGELREQVAAPDDVDALEGEEEQLQFVQNFRELMRLRNILISFVDFDFTDTSMDEQEFADFKSKYLDIYDKVRSDTAKEQASILDDVDFEVELIKRDEINVDYILRLLKQLVDIENEDQKQAITKNIMDAVSGEAELRSKQELIEKFIEQNLPKISDSDMVEDEFYSFWDEEKMRAFERLCQEEGLMTDELQKIIDNYLYLNRKPRRDEIVGALEEKPKVMERNSIIARINKKLDEFINTFIEGV